MRPFRSDVTSRAHRSRGRARSSSLAAPTSVRAPPAVSRSVELVLDAQRGGGPHREVLLSLGQLSRAPQTMGEEHGVVASSSAGRRLFSLVAARTTSRARRLVPLTRSRSSLPQAAERAKTPPTKAGSQMVVLFNGGLTVGHCFRGGRRQHRRESTLHRAQPARFFLVEDVPREDGGDELAHHVPLLGLEEKLDQAPFVESLHDPDVGVTCLFAIALVKATRSREVAARESASNGGRCSAPAHGQWQRGKEGIVKPSASPTEIQPCRRLGRDS